MVPPLHHLNSEATVYQTPVETTRRIKKRNRIPVSCVQCQTRRSKCDRERPCAQCKQRGQEGQCAYGRKQATSLEPSDGRQDENADSADGGSAQDRLEKLERVVRQIMHHGSISTSQESAEDEQNALAVTSSDADNTRSAKKAKWRVDAGQTHWSTILDSIDELKSAINMKAPTMSQWSYSPGQETSLLSCKGHFTLEDVIMQYMPPRTQVDRRLSLYFNAHYIVIPIIHSRQFLRQYEAFWQQPSYANSAWVSMLFSMLALSCTLNIATGTDDREPRLAFLDAAAKCLNAAGYLTGLPFVMEALLLYAQCKSSMSMDTCTEVTYILPMVCRLAFQHGLHREPSPGFSPFEAERRRRLWLMARHFDVQVSAYMGVPLSIPPECHDTQNAHNLLDTDFDEDSASLPPERPPTEITPASAFVRKSRLMDVFARIYQLTLSLEPPLDGQVTKLEADLRHQYESLPPPWRWKPMSQSFVDGPHIIMVRLNTELLFQKSLCLLHRKQMAEGDPKSKRICLDAAKSIVQRINDLNNEMQPGGQMDDNTWMMTSTVVNDFLLASMILALTIIVSVRKALALAGSKIPRWPPEQRPEIESLETAYRICQGLVGQSHSAQKVATAIHLTLKRYNEFYHVEPLMTTSDVDSVPLLMPPFMPFGATPMSNNDQNLNTLPDLNGGSDGTAEWSQIDSFFDNHLDIDWTIFDRYIGS